MAPKTTKETWNLIKLDFDSGNYKSICELARKHGVNESTLHNRISTQKWSVKKKESLERISKKLEEKVVSRADSYLSSLQLRVEKYEKIIDASIENLGSKTKEGIPLLDPEAIDQFTRSEGRLQSMGAFAHRIAAVSQVDITSKGESLVAILDRMRASPDKIIHLSDDQVKLISESEIVD